MEETVKLKAFAEDKLIVAIMMITSVLAKLFQVLTDSIPPGMIYWGEAQDLVVFSKLPIFSSHVKGNHALTLYSIDTHFDT